MYLIDARNMEDTKLIRPSVYFGCKRSLWSSTANRCTGALKQENICRKKLEASKSEYCIHRHSSIHTDHLLIYIYIYIYIKRNAESPTVNPPKDRDTILPLPSVRCSTFLPTKGVQPESSWLAFNRHPSRIPNCIPSILASRIPSRKIWGPVPWIRSGSPRVSTSKIHNSPSANQSTARSLLLKAWTKKLQVFLCVLDRASLW